ncbi:MAG: hypothetical protein ACI85O_002392 [Saprospiraceae bacterium]|jgi:hypothetical protein
MSNEMYKGKLTLLGTEIKRGDSICLQFDVAKLHTRNSIKVPIFVERGKKMDQFCYCSAAYMVIK